jgi:hypothetical protein
MQPVNGIQPFPIAQRKGAGNIPIALTATALKNAHGMIKAHIAMKKDVGIYMITQHALQMQIAIGMQTQDGAVKAAAGIIRQMQLVVEMPVAMGIVRGTVSGITVMKGAAGLKQMKQAALMTQAASGKQAQADGVIRKAAGTTKTRPHV